MDAHKIMIVMWHANIIMASLITVLILYKEFTRITELLIADNVLIHTQVETITARYGVHFKKQ